MSGDQADHDKYFAEHVPMSDNGTQPVYPCKMDEPRGGEWQHPGMNIRTHVATEIAAALLQSPRVNREMTEADIAARAVACTDHLLAALASTEPAQDGGDAKLDALMFIRKVRAVHALGGPPWDALKAEFDELYRDSA